MEGCSAVYPSGFVVVENGPADTVPAPLVLEDKGTQATGNLPALPIPLSTGSIPLLIRVSRRSGSLDGICG